MYNNYYWYTGCHPPPPSGSLDDSTAEGGVGPSLLQVISQPNIRITKYKYYNIPRVPMCLSPRPNWDPPQSLSRKRVCPPGTKEGGEGEGVGGPNSDD